MASTEARLKKLDKKAQNLEALVKKAKVEAKKGKGDIAKLKKDVAKAQKDIAQIIKWIQSEVAWSAEVTKMLRMIDWAALAVAFPGTGGTNPPQTPPDWPPPEA
ncbi:MAG TPA: hypothetical protein VIK50_13725 [Gemmatimonadaceae bacterium]